MAVRSLQFMIERTTARRKAAGLIYTIEQKESGELQKALLLLRWSVVSGVGRHVAHEGPVSANPEAAHRFTNQPPLRHRSAISRPPYRRYCVPLSFHQYNSGTVIRSLGVKTG